MPKVFGSVSGATRLLRPNSLLRASFHIRWFSRSQTTFKENYVYKPLIDDCRAIRIAVLHPGCEADTIRISLKEHILHSSSDYTAPPSYTALSYVWGNPTVTTPIEIDSRQSQITTNLASALRHLRIPSEPRVFWIDAICINQNDMPEREAQVSLMGTIYRQSHQIIAWLGPASEDSDLAMEMLARSPISEASSGGVSIEALMEFQRGLVALRRIYQRKWWRRAWIIQEATIKDKPVQLICGHKKTNWTNIVDCLSILHRVINSAQMAYGTTSHGQRESIIYDEVRKGLLEVLASADFLAAQQSHDDASISFTSQLGRVRMFEASDARDKVWIAEALPSSRAKPSHEVKPDYSMSVRDTYFYSVQKCLLHDQLDFLDHCHLNSESWSNLPSFVPDWRLPPSREILLGTHQAFDASRGQRHNATRDSIRDIGSGTLCVSGFIIDQVEARLLSKRINLYYHTGLNDILTGLLMRRLQGNTSVEGVLRSTLDIMTAGYSLHNSDVEEALNSTASIPSFQSPRTRQDIRYFSKDIKSFLKGIPDAEERAVRVWQGRCIVEMSKHGLVLAPNTTQPGDVLCILFGSKVPVLLRPSSDGTFGVVGGCYVPGVMYGEGFESEEPEIRDFKLV